VKYELHTISIGQSTLWDLVQKPGLRRIPFDRSFLRRILSHKKWSAAHLFHTKKNLTRDAFDFKFFYYVYLFIGSENDYNSNTE